MEPLLVNVKEAGRLTSLSPYTIRAHIRSGRIEVVRVGRRGPQSRSGTENISSLQPGTLNPTHQYPRRGYLLGHGGSMKRSFAILLFVVPLLHAQNPTGTGTANYIAKWSSTTNLTVSA